MHGLTFEGIEIPVRVVETSNRNAYARIRDMEAIITIPKKLNGKERERVVYKLARSLQRSLDHNPGKMMGFRRQRFHEGQVLSMPGYFVSLHISEGMSRFSSRISSNKLTVLVPKGVAQDSDQAIRYMHKAVSRTFTPMLQRLVSQIGRDSFGTEIGTVRIGKGMTVLGSCDMRNNITLNARLLAMGGYALEYVIVHELAHTMQHNHSRKFWKLVESAMPDYRERRKWIYAEGWRSEIG